MDTQDPASLCLGGTNRVHEMPWFVQFVVRGAEALVECWECGKDAERKI
jgi:hypothetical protein